MIDTIKVPKNKLKPTFLFGFLISPAIKVTPFQASLENTDPTNAAEIPVIRAVPLIGSQLLSDASKLRDTQAFVQFASQISDFAASKNPNTISPRRENILIIVRTV